MVKTRGQEQPTEDPDPSVPPPPPPNPMELMAQMMQLFMDQQQQQQLQNQQQQEQTQRVLDQNQQLLQALSTSTTGSSRTNRHNMTSSTHLPELKGLSRPKLTGPETLTIQQFQDWKNRWTDFSNAQQLGRHSVPTQQGQLREAIDTEWRLLWEAHILEIDESMLPEQIIDIMQAYLRGMRNPLWDRQAFHRRDQQDNEGIQHYYATLKTLDDACDHDRELRCQCGEELTVTCSDPMCNHEFHLKKTLQDIRIRDRLICGLANKDTQEKILAKQHKDSMIKLQDVIDTCAAAEFAAKSRNKLSATDASPILATSRRPSSYRKALTQSRSSSPVPSSSTSEHVNRNESECESCGLMHRNRRCPATNQRCIRCKVEGHFVKMCNRCPGCPNPKHKSRQDCPFWNHQCIKCQEWNHSELVCGYNGGSGKLPPKSPFNSRPSSRSPSPPRRNSSINSVVCQISAGELISISVDLHGKRRRIQFLPDSGAFVNAIGIRMLDKLDRSLREAIVIPGKDAFAANGTSLGPIGAIPITFHLNGKSHQTYLQVYKDLTTPLLGKEACQALSLLSKAWPHDQIQDIHSITSGKIVLVPPPAPLNFTEQQTRLIDQYPEVFNEHVLSPMEGPPMKIELVDDAKPCKEFRARTIPYGWKDKVKEQLDTMVERGIIEKVPVGTQIDWCHPMVVVPKKESSEPRFTVDFTGLNRYVRRPAYPVRTPREVVAGIPPGMRYFTTLDARQGYWQIPLHPESVPLTTFMTPWGSYRYLRNPMGLISAGDEHNRRGDEALEGIQNMGRVVEDTILYDKDLDTHVRRLCDVLERCKQTGITLNRKKFIFAQPQVDWCGFTVNEAGYTPSPHLTEALRHFPVPVSKTDVRSFLGMAQQFESFSSRIAELSTPIRGLLSSKSAFVWEQPHQAAFEAIIRELTSSRILTQFEPRRRRRLETDAAQTKGLGYVLYQQEPTDEWKILRCGSRSITPTESRYSASEIEMLAVVWAVKKCRTFLLGEVFDLVVDHKPLIPLIPRH